ncbi:MAG: proton-conducting transporter membrane subunit [Bacteroidota bacterium]|nr:proton-conducting transporter membrane subunit [Bacteroidota bacterium]
MNFVWGFLLIPLLAICVLPFLSMKGKAIAVYAVISSIAILTGTLAFQGLAGQNFALELPGSLISGSIELRVDALSAWFILIIDFTFLTGGFYGLFYMKAYADQPTNLTLHSILFILLHASLVSLCAIQNSIAFLVAWEIMALSAFLCVIFEHEKVATIRAGINFLIQSHISILFLMLGFIWVASQTGSYDFSAIHSYSMTHPGALSLMLFLFFFIGFAIKAGFVPFHTWLPYAHPAAPAPISGIMSGVLIKIGIFGILRMLLLIDLDYTVVGIVILILSIISGVYGVMLAILQHNLKRLLAYHSIENIGIIGIGIGLGCIGLGTNHPVLCSLGFAGALLHTLNHSLFKSLLFFTAGNVYQATHTLDIEKLGGLVKKMPQTAILFLLASLAICGLPPFNGFISEFILYTGLFSWLQQTQITSLIGIIVTVSGLVLIGGLALICFTKAFGVVFLGNPRHVFHQEIKEVPFFQLLPLYFIAAFIVLIGMFPTVFLEMLIMPVQLFTGLHQLPFTSFRGNGLEVLASVSQAGWCLVALVLLLLGIRKLVLRKRNVTVLPTWNCGYTAPTAKIQYTASSFVKSYSKLFGMLFLIFKKEKEVEGIFPTVAHLETRPYDKIEKWLIDTPTTNLRVFLGRFRFVQNGRLQFYILYGILFIVSVISIPILYDTVKQFVEFLKEL